MKFSQLKEYKMKNIFPKNHTQKVVEKLFSNTFIQNQNWAYLSIDKSEMLESLVLKYVRVEVYQKMFKLRYWKLAFILYKAFLKNKKRSRTSLPASFSDWLLKSNIAHVMFYWLIKFRYLIAFSSWDIAQYVYCNNLLLHNQKFKTKS